MKNINKNNQTGRSMVEMLGVLAIIGVLSVGGIAGYSKAMSKYKLTKTIDQVSMIIANARTMFASQTDYGTFDTDDAVNLGLFPEDMFPGAATTPVNAYQGSVELEATAANDAGLATAGEGFKLTYSGLDKETCATLATADWGTGAASGLVGMSVSGGEWILQEDASGNKTLPVSPASAAAADACGADDPSVSWVYQ